LSARVPHMALAFTDLMFADAAALADALAVAVGAALTDAIAVRGRALLALSGGTTPALFLRRLGEQAVDWKRVIVTLCDERWVPPQHERSNARLVREMLLHGSAAAARFVPLYTDAPDPESGAAEIEQRIAALPLPLDAVVLGMGNDGHTASFFPDADRLATALDPRTQVHVTPIRAPTADEPRITLTLPVLAGARSAYLQIEGASKRSVFQAVVAGEGSFAASPMRTVMQHAHTPLAVYWCA
jgi:6-phosphogluconolactonase